MTEKEWWAATVLQPMLTFLHGQGKRRQIRLFPFACYRRIWNQLDEGVRRIAQAAEDYLNSSLSHDQFVEFSTSTLQGIQDETQVRLAEAIRDVAARGTYGNLTLADALEDAGCGNEDVVGHCRSDGPHVYGCWVLAMLLRTG